MEILARWECIRDAILAAMQYHSKAASRELILVHSPQKSFMRYNTKKSEV